MEGTKKIEDAQLHKLTQKRFLNHNPKSRLLGCKKSIRTLKLSLNQKSELKDL